MITFLLFLFLPYQSPIVNGNVTDHESKGMEHAIYISVIEIEQITDNDQATLKVKVFINDLEDAIRNQSGSRVDYKEGCVTHQTALVSYFKEHLNLAINDIPIVFNLDHCETLKDALWVSFVFEQPTSWEQLDLSTDLFTELFPTQSNIVSVSYLKDKRFARLNKTDHTAHFTFSH